MSDRFGVSQFRLAEGESLRLRDRATRVPPISRTPKEDRRLLKAKVRALSRLQRLHYAANAHAMLIIFQGMDAAGKDGVISHLMTGLNPQGCEVTSFKHPSASELTHDFLWRSAQRLPERGRIGVFNRSYYEEVLIVRVHPELLEAEGVPSAPRDEAGIWESRYRSIRDFEHHLGRNGVKVVKIFLHLSKEEQRLRFLSRIDEPEKNWKFSMADVEERAFWDNYEKAYEACLESTSTDAAPWFVVPADDKLTSRMIVSQIILEALSELHPQFPKTPPERRRALKRVRAALEAEG